MDFSRILTVAGIPSRLKKKVKIDTNNWICFCQSVCRKGKAICGFAGIRVSLFVLQEKFD